MVSVPYFDIVDPLSFADNRTWLIRHERAGAMMIQLLRDDRYASPALVGGGDVLQPAVHRRCDLEVTGIACLLLMTRSSIRSFERFGATEFTDTSLLDQSDILPLSFSQSRSEPRHLSRNCCGIHELHGSCLYTQQHFLVITGADVRGKQIRRSVLHVDARTS